MGALKKIGHFFESIIHKIEDALKTIVNTLKEIAKGLEGVLKIIMEKVIALAEAVATGNLEEIAKKFADLGMAMANAPGDIAGTVVGSAVKLVGGMAAQMLGQEPPDWLNKVAGAASIASHFTNPASALQFAEREVAGAVTGNGSEFENFAHDIK